jgi:hypothetical protein
MGRVALPSGVMIPRWVTGTWLRDRDEWHRLNLGQETATSLFCALAPRPGIIHLPEPLRSGSPEQNSSRYRSGTLFAHSDAPSYVAQLAQELLSYTF